jgi:N-acetyltransferase 10
MGYGSRALSLLKMYYEFLIPNIDERKFPKENIDSIQEEEVDLLEEKIGINTNTFTKRIRTLNIYIIIFLEPRNNLPPLLLKLSERPPERLDYIGVSFGLTGPLLKFWKKSGFIPLYIR